MEKDSIYFIAIIPPLEVCDSITALRQDFAERFNSRAAMRIIPHITLKAPFKIPAASQPGLWQWFQGLSFSTGPFSIELKDFGVFNKKRNPVVFVHPVLTPTLASLQQEVIRSFRLAYPDIGVTSHEMQFHPHITIAYRDLDIRNFLEAWKEYQHKEYRTSFEADRIVLLQHDERKWNVADTRLIR